MEILWLIEALLRRKVLFVSTFTIILGTAIAAAVLVPPAYQASSKVLVRASSDSLSSLMSALDLGGADGGNALTQSKVKGMEEPYATEVALMTIRPSIETLIRELNLKVSNGDPMEPEKLTRSSIVSVFLPRPHVEVEQFEDTNMLEVTAVAGDPALAANMANRLASLFIEGELERTREGYGSVREFISNHISEIEKRYLEILSEKLDFEQTEDTVDLNAEIQKLLELIFDLRMEYESNEIAIAQADESIRIVEEKLAGKGYVSASMVDKLESQTADLLVALSSTSGELTSDHPDIIQMNRELDAIKEVLIGKANFVVNVEALSLAPVYGDLVKDVVKAYIDKKAGEVKRASLKTYIDQTNKQLAQIPVKNMKNSEIELTLSVQQSIYQSVLEYRTQVGIAEAMTISDSKLIEPAIEDPQPTAPSLPLNVVVGTALGLFWAVGLVLLVEYLDNTVKDPGDLAESGIPVLGTVPFSPGEPLLTSLDPNDPCYESHRGIVAGIESAHAGVFPRTILVSGIDPRVGSSTVLVNLGIALAAGRRVLLLDTDLRRPTLHTLLGRTNENGVTSLLTRDGPEGNAIQSTDVKDLFLLASGPPPADTGLLLRSERFAKLVTVLLSKFDILLFDSAPMSVKNDAIILMERVESTILVARSGVTTSGSIKRIKALLARTAGETRGPIGLILNCHDRVSNRMRRRNRNRLQENAHEGDAVR